MPFPGTPRSSFGHVVLDDRIYISGGHLGRYHHYPKGAFAAEFHSVDIATGSDVRPLRQMKIPTQGHRLTTFGDDIFSFGGFCYDEQLDYGPDPNSFEWYARSSDAVWRYSIKTDEWFLFATLPRRRSSNVIGVTGNIAYLIGGWDGTPWARNDYVGRLHSVCELFDLAVGKVLPNEMLMPTPRRRAFTGIVLGGKLYVAGGVGAITDEYPEGQNFDEFASYDLATNTWSSSYYGQLPKLKRPLFSPGMGVVGKTLVLTGGSEPSHQRNQRIWLWKPGMPDWVENSSSLSEGVTFPEIVEAGPSKALAFGGHGK